MDSDHEGAVSSEYQRWVDQERNHEEACFLTFCGTRATDSTTGVPRKHRGTYTAKKRMEIREYIAATGVSVRRASVEFNIPKSTIQDIKSSTAMPPKGKVHKKGAGRPLSYSLEKEQTLVSWIVEIRDLYLPVSIAEVKQKAKEIIGEENPSFKASSGWTQKFFKRNQFTLHAKTSLSQYLPKDLEERLTSFIASMKQYWDRRTILWLS